MRFRSARVLGRGLCHEPKSNWQLCPPAKPKLQEASSSPSGSAPRNPIPEGDALRRLLVPSTSATDLSFPGAPPPPPKRHCRSLSVPEDLSRCRSAWRPSASKVWTPVKRRCHSGGGAGGSCPLRAPSSSLASSLRSSSSPTFFSLALSPDSPLPWSFPWEPGESARGGGCCCSLPSASCASSPSPLCPPLVPQRRFSLSPLPRCHSQPCDLRKPGLKRRHDPDTTPCARPGLDFSKMTQVSKGKGGGRWKPPQNGGTHELKYACVFAHSVLVPVLSWVRRTALQPCFMARLLSDGRY
ncbi:hypothetical protein Z043_105844 [Scleropages formosus]|uniref:Protein FAM53C-like n=1 Tax=Scleropages formosus TaxID=113540 RepID=A0A0P7XFF9_SCLFO|nr:hypothetical protein Z043_105844 [Scleropages formosus]